jgi:hypothetical protein
VSRRRPGLATGSDCPYYQGVGICGSGCWEEPTCVTEEPTRGWPAYEAASAREMAWEETGNHGKVKHWRDVARHFDKREVREVTLRTYVRVTGR